MKALLLKPKIKSIPIVVGKDLPPPIQKGFPPKLFQLMISEICAKNDIDKISCKILDYSYGSGYIGKYLSEENFYNLSKLDFN